MKVVLFGDSLLKGLWKELIEKIEASAPNADVYNCSVSGWDTEDAIRKAPYISKLKPDIVILGFGTNDAAPWKQIPLDDYLENIKKLLEIYKTARIIYFLPPPVEEDNGHNKEHRRFPETVRQYHDAAKELLDKKGVDYVDSFKVFGELDNKGQQYHVKDGVHLNDLGYEVLIKELSRLLNSHE